MGQSAKRGSEGGVDGLLGEFRFEVAERDEASF